MHNVSKIYTEINVSNNKRGKESGTSGRWLLQLLMVWYTILIVI